MIPCSPILLVAAAQAMARDDRTVVGASSMSDGDAMATGMPFIHHAGYWSHYEEQLGVSSWPLDPRWSLAQVVQMAKRFELLQLDGSPGDLLVTCNEDGTPSHIGIVLAAGDRLQFPCEAPTWECEALWGTLTGRGSRRGAWFRGGRGDRFIPWYWMPHYHSLTPRRRAA